MTVKKELDHFQSFFIPTILLWVIGGIILILTDKGDIVLWASNNHTPFLDTCFKFITQIAEEVVVLSIGFIILLFSYKNSLLFLLSHTLSGLTAQLLKKTVFRHSVRPAKLFEHLDLNFVDGYPILKAFSFPSGHATAAFAMFTALAILFPKYKWFQWFCLLMAALVAFSRVYLLVHFLSGCLCGFNTWCVVYVGYPLPRSEI